MRLKARFIYAALSALCLWVSYGIPQLLEDGTRLYAVYVFAMIGPFFAIMFLALAIVPSALDKGNTSVAASRVITAAFILACLSGLVYFIYILYYYF